MAQLNVDTSQATANVQKLNSALDSTQDSIKETNKVGNALNGVFEQVGKAAKDMADGMSAADVVLNAVASTGQALQDAGKAAVKVALPELRKALSATTFSFKALAKAIAATGLGLLIQALGVIITRWKDITAWMSRFNEAIKDTMPGLSRIITSLQNFGARITNFFQRFSETKLGQWFGRLKTSIQSASQGAGQLSKDMYKDAIDAAAAEEKVKGLTGAVKEYKSERKSYDPIGSVEGGTLAQRSAMAASAVSSTKQQLEQVETVTEAYKKQKSILDMIDEAFQKMNADAVRLSATQKANASAIMTSIATISGSIAGAVEQNSAAYKALMTVQVIATTAMGAMTAFTAVDNVTMVQKWASFAAILAAGAAQLVALYQNKLETKTVSAVAPTLAAPMTGGQQAATIAQITSTTNDSQVYITDRQLQDNDAQNVKLKNSTVY